MAGIVDGADGTVGAGAGGVVGTVAGVVTGEAADALGLGTLVVLDDGEGGAATGKVVDELVEGGDK